MKFTEYINVDDFINTEDQHLNLQLLVPEENSNYTNQPKLSNIQQINEESLPKTIIKSIARKDYLNNIDWFKILKSVKLKLIICFIAAIGLSGISALYVQKVWESKSFYQTSSKLLYSPSKDRSRQILNKATAVKMLIKKSHLDKLHYSPEIDNLSELKKSISVSSDPKTGIISIISKGNTKESVIAIASATAELAVSENRLFYKEAIHRKFQNALNQLLLTEEYLKGQEEKIVSLKEKYGIIDFKENSRIAMESISLRQKSLLEAEITLEKQKIELRVLKEEFTKMPNEILRNSYEDNPLKARLTNTKLALLNAKITYGESNPNVTLLQETVEALEKQLGKQDLKSTMQRVYEPNLAKTNLKLEIIRKNSYLQATEERIKRILADISKHEKKLNSSPSYELILEKEIRRKKATEDQLLTLRKKANQHQSHLKSDYADFSIYSKPDKAELVRPVKYLVLPFATFVVCGSLSVLFFGLKELFDSRLRTKSQVSKLFDLKFLFTTHQHEENFYEKIRELARSIKANYPLKGCVNFYKLKDRQSSYTQELAQYFNKLGFKTVLVKFSKDDSHQCLKTFLKSDLNIEISQNSENNCDTYCFNIIEDLSDLVFSSTFYGFKEGLKERYEIVLFELPSFSNSSSLIELSDKSDFSIFEIDSCEDSGNELQSSIKMLEANGISMSAFILKNIPNTFMRLNK